MSDHQYLERLCREHGKQPTTRERWTAFWRLWRIVQKNYDPSFQGQEAFRVLMFDWRWIILASDPGDFYASLRFLPRSVRRYRVGMDERLTP